MDRCSTISKIQITGYLRTVFLLLATSGILTLIVVMKNQGHIRRSFNVYLSRRESGVGQTENNSQSNNDKSNDSINMQSVNESTKILLMTYFRGGSTFLGESFNRNPEAFYWFEPSELLSIRMKKTSPYVMGKDGNISKIPAVFAEETCQTIVRILNCRLDQLGSDHLTHYFVLKWHKSLSLDPYKKCMNHYQPADGQRYPEDIIRRCLPLANDACRRAKIRTVKAIRVAAYMLPRMLELDPQLKIVHYVRDPRAMLLSASEMQFVGKHREAIDRWTRLLCYRMHQDYVMTRDRKWMGKLLSLRYEDLATNYSAVLSKIYSFIGRQVPGKVDSWFKANTNSSQDNGQLGTSRMNSTATAVRWRHVLNNDVIKLLKENCFQVYKDYGYDVI